MNSRRPFQLHDHILELIELRRTVDTVASQPFSLLLIHSELPPRYAALTCIRISSAGASIILHWTAF